MLVLMSIPVTSNLTLRDVTEADLPIFFEHQIDPESTRMAAFPPRQRDAFMEHWRTKILSDPTGIAKTIVVDGKVAGNIVCFEQSDKLLVGYWIGRDYWGKGVATSALSAFLHQVARRPLYAHVAKHNVGSIRVLEKCGFTACGTSQGDDGVEEFIFVIS